MVEITRDNLNEMVPEVERAIKNACFIAIDTEFTGLNLGPENDIRLFDTLEERYQKLKSRATNFIPCQVGITAFSKVGNDLCYKAVSFTFFIRPYMCGSADKRFILQASSLDFLCRHNFNFNKFIGEGIPYLNETEEMQVKKEMEDGTISYAHEKSLDIKSQREQDILVNKFLGTLQLLRENPENRTTVDKKTDKIRLTFPKDRIYHEYFQVQQLRLTYPSLWAYCTGDKIVVEEVSAEEKKALQENEIQERRSVLDYYLGFTKIFRMLKECKKPMIGHNLLMDLLLFYQSFHKPLPGTFKEFKTELHRIFPCVYDTRHIWLNIKKICSFKNLPKRAALFDLYAMFKNPPDELLQLYSPDIQSSNCPEYSSENFCHESGYDSFVTGYVFTKICHLLAVKKISNPICIQSQTFKQHLKAVKPFVNKLNIGRSRERFINLEGDDPLPSVPEFLYIHCKNSDRILNQKELAISFDKYPMVELKVAKNKKSALIAVGSPLCYQNILRDFEKDPDFVVTKYSMLRHSPMVTTALWFSIVGSSLIAALFAAKHFSN